jgi:hypothetical protein
VLQPEIALTSRLHPAPGGLGGAPWPKLATLQIRQKIIAILTRM